MLNQLKLILPTTALVLLTVTNANAGVDVRNAAPPAPGAWQPEAGGCWKSILSEVNQSRTYSLSGHTFVERRRVVTALHKCPGQRYVVRVWASRWAPPVR